MLLRSSWPTASTGKGELRRGKLWKMLMATACLLQLPEVVDACSSFLIRQLHPSNCLGIRLFADSQSCVRLLTVAQHYTADHFIDVIGSQEFVLLPADEVAKLLANEDLNVPNEELMFQALMLWLRHDLPDRQKELPRLLSLVKLLFFHLNSSLTISRVTPSSAKSVLSRLM